MTKDELKRKRKLFGASVPPLMPTAQNRTGSIVPQVAPPLLQQQSAVPTNEASPMPGNLPPIVPQLRRDIQNQEDEVNNKNASYLKGIVPQRDLQAKTEAPLLTPQGIGRIVPQTARLPVPQVAPPLNGSGLLPPSDLPVPSAQEAAQGVQFQKRSIVPVAPVLTPQSGDLRQPLDKTPSERTQEDINAIQSKDYSIRKDESGNVTYRGKDRDSDHNWWDVTKSALIGLAEGGIGGAVRGAIGGAADRNFDEKAIDRYKVARLEQQRRQQAEAEQQTQGYRLREAQLNELQRRPQKEQEAYERKLELEAQRQANRIELIQERDRARGERYKLEIAKDGSGRLEKVYGDGRREDFTDPTTGEVVINPGERLIERTLEDGTRVFVKGSQVLSSETAEKWRRITANSRIEENNLDDSQRYARDSAELGGKITAAQTRINSINGELSGLQNPQYAEDFQRRDRLQKELRDAQAELAGYQAQLKNLPKPARRETLPSNVGTYSERQFRELMKGKYSPAQVEILVKNAKAQGIIRK